MLGYIHVMRGGYTCGQRRGYTCDERIEEEAATPPCSARLY